MGLDHPYWVMDPNFDLDFHIRHMSLAPPGRRDQLAEQVARIVGRPMDRTRPLWEVYVIEGLEDGSWALLTKYHHATIDGASGVIMMTMMNDLTPDAAAARREPAVGARGDPERRRAAAPRDRQPRAQPGQGDAAAAAHRPRLRRRGRHHGRQLGGPAGRRGDQGAGRAVRRAAACRSRCRPRRRRRGTRASPPTAASPCAPPRSATSSGSRPSPAARSTTSSWRSSPARCAPT